MVDAVKLLGSLLGGMGGSSGGGIGGMLLKGVLSSALGGGQSSQGGGGLGGLLGALAGGQQPSSGMQQGGGGLGDLLGSLAGGGGAQQGGGLGGLLGSLSGGQQATGGNQSSMVGNVLMGALNQFIGGGGQQAGGSQLASFADLPSESQNEQALVVIRAMFNAAKADGQVDQQEYAGIIDSLDDDGISEEEKQFVEAELSSPLQPAAEFAASVPAELRQSAYVASLCAITLDNNDEARYLHELAQSFGMDAEACNAIHQRMGAPVLYS